jgi:hypothetical protein
MHAEVLSCRFRGRPPLIPISFLLLQLVLAGRYSARSRRGSLCRQMIQTICSRHNVATERIYVTGLSAGGAMANVLLSTVPRPLLGRDYCRPAIRNRAYRLGGIRADARAGHPETARTAGQSSRSIHSFGTMAGNLRLHGTKDSTVAVDAGIERYAHISCVGGVMV